MRFEIYATNAAYESEFLFTWNYGKDSGLARARSDAANFKRFDLHDFRAVPV